MGFWWGDLRQGDYLEDFGVDGGKVLKWIFRKWDVGDVDWIELAQDRDSWRALVNEPSGSIKCEEFLDWLRNC
jgi:hypothetical protein